MSWPLLLALVHIIGTALGVGGATYAEIFFLRAERDGRIDHVEEDFLRTTYRVLRIGLILLILSGFGFLVLFRLTGHTEFLHGAKLWSKLTIIGILLFGMIAWQARKIPLWLGSAISLTSWYAALVLGAWRGLHASYFSIMTVYFAVLLCVGVALQFIRRKIRKRV